MYTLSPGDNGSISLSFLQGDDLLNCIILSLTIMKGRWWLHPDFGLVDRRREKNTPSTRRRISADIVAALQWLITDGRLRSVDVSLEVAAPTRLEALITAVAADGRPITYTKFIEVV